MDNLNVAILRFDVNDDNYLDSGDNSRILYLYGILTVL